MVNMEQVPYNSYNICLPGLHSHIIHINMKDLWDYMGI